MTNTVVKRVDRSWMTQDPNFKGRSFIVFIADKSGSMNTIRDAVVAGYNEWLTLVQQGGHDVLFTLTLFDGYRFTPIVNVPINDVLPLTHDRYTPGGSTALYDSVVETVLETDGQVTDDDRVLVVILTDGQDAGSRHHNVFDVRLMIEDYEARGNWTFTYLSSDPNVWNQAQSMGILGANAAAFDQSPESAKAAMRAIAESTIAYVESDDMATDGFYKEVGQSEELLALGFRAGS